MTSRPDPSADTAVLGYDPTARTWVTGPAATTTSFAAVPPIEGELLADEAARQAVATDLGNITVQAPGAVLRPRSAEDVAAMVRFCREHGITVSTRGQAHTTLGQGLTDGLLVEARSLNRIHSLGPDTAEVDAGVHWKDLVLAGFDHSPRLTPPAVTGYTSLTVGGTLSVGGLGGLVGALRTGLQVDHVRELEVVTGTGDIVRCSAHHRRDLFEAVLGGLGQCGIITKAVLDLVPARRYARTYVLEHTDNAAFFRDLRIVIEHPGIDHVYAELYAPGAEPTHKCYATVFHDGPTPPDDETVLAGLAAEPAVEDTGYLDYVFTIDRLVDGMRDTVGWDGLLKPWYDVWLTGSVVEDYIAELHPTLTARDIGPFGISLIYPQRRSTITRPLPRLPEPDGSDWVFVLDINTVAETPGADPEFVKEMLERNTRLFADARDRYGAVLYPIGSVPFTEQDWRAHYGDQWETFRDAKKRYDPDSVLTPGPGIFRNG